MSVNVRGAAECSNMNQTTPTKRAHDAGSAVISIKKNTIRHNENGISFIVNMEYV